MEDTERLRAEHTYSKEKGESWELDEDEDKARIQLVKELEENIQGYSIKEWEDVIAKELGIFKEDDYNFAKDLKHAYHRSLKTTTEQKIFDSIPDHYFWDIKASQFTKPYIRKNRYNPYRGREHESFF